MAGEKQLTEADRLAVQAELAALRSAKKVGLWGGHDRSYSTAAKVRFPRLR